MAKQGTMQNPEYKTRSGITLKIGAVNAAAMQLYMSLWEKQHRPPKPPLITLANGEQWHNTTEAMFQQLYQAWQGEYNTAMMDFVLKHGVLSKPPANWKNPYSEFDGMDEHIQKQVWLSVILQADNEVNEYTELSQAILSLNRPTAEGTEEAEKK